MSRFTMTFLCDIEREYETADRDPANQPLTDRRMVYTGLRCSLPQDREFLSEDTTRRAQVGNLIMRVPIEADVRKEDFVKRVTDRLGAVVFQDLEVLTVARRYTHFEIGLRGVQ